jgi:hypothetical protein
MLLVALGRLLKQAKGYRLRAVLGRFGFFRGSDWANFGHSAKLHHATYTGTQQYQDDWIYYLIDQAVN